MMSRFWMQRASATRRSWGVACFRDLCRRSLFVGPMPSLGKKGRAEQQSCFFLSLSLSLSQYAMFHLKRVGPYCRRHRLSPEAATSSRLLTNSCESYLLCSSPSTSCSSPSRACLGRPGWHLFSLPPHSHSFVSIPSGWGDARVQVLYS